MVRGGILALLHVGMLVVDEAEEMLSGKGRNGAVFFRKGRAEGSITWYAIIKW